MHYSLKIIQTAKELLKAEGISVPINLSSGPNWKLRLMRRYLQRKEDKLCLTQYSLADLMILGKIKFWLTVNFLVIRDKAPLELSFKQRITDFFTARNSIGKTKNSI